MLGIPKEDQGRVFKAGGPGARLLDPVPLSRAELDAANAGTLAAAQYFHALFELRRRKPQNDLITLLVQAEEEGGKLSNEELTSNIVLLYIAGHVTTTPFDRKCSFGASSQSQPTRTLETQSLP